MQLISLPQDKANHVIYGALITLVALVAFNLFGVQHSAALALAVCAIMGIAKEAVDHISNLINIREGKPPEHGVEFLDAVATVAGGLLIFLAAAI
jgi:hypothetical protein